MTDFTAANGATRGGAWQPSLGSWTRCARRRNRCRRDAGGLGIVLGRRPLLHGGGSNESNDSRYGLILTYSCAWLRQEENQYLEFSREAIAKLDPELRKVVGFTMHGALGYRDPRL